jgi:hypothetical protein
VWVHPPGANLTHGTCETVYGNGGAEPPERTRFQERRRSTPL